MSINYHFKISLLILGLIFFSTSCANKTEESGYGNLGKEIFALEFDPAQRSELVVLTESGCDWCYETTADYYSTNKSDAGSPMVILVSNRKKARKSDFFLLNSISKKDFIISNNLNILTELSNITKSPKGPFILKTESKLISNVSLIN